MADVPQYLHEGIVAKFLVGLTGSLVSLKFIQGPWTERALLCFGGAVLSYHATPIVTAYFHAPAAEGLFGFLLGLFGMAISAKAYEGIQYIDAKRFVQVSSDFWLKRFEKKSTEKEDV